MTNYNLSPAPGPLRFSRIIFMVLMGLSGVVIFSTYQVKIDTNFNEEQVIERSFQLHKIIVDQFYQTHKTWITSNLGAVLYKNEEYPALSEERRNKTFVILIWKYWKMLQNRHVYYYGSTRHDPLEGCSVNNCIFTGDDEKLNSADAVVVHLHRGQIPGVENRNRSQRWIFLNDESPFNVFSLATKKPWFDELHNVFNWSMTYRSDSDIPVPYGRTVALRTPKFVTSDPPISEIVPNWKVKRRDVLAAILMSNCVPYRMELIKQLKEYVKVDVHGKCGDNELKNSCPGHFKSDCEAMSQYLFYLVLENSKCKEYMTEKLFHNAYSRGAIPIIQGPSAEECKSFLPPNSYLHLDDYDSPKQLAEEIQNISKDENRLLYYHKWRNNFDVANEHGYFGSKSFHLCRLCEAMNYNIGTESVYSEDHVRRFLDPAMLCRK